MKKFPSIDYPELYSIKASARFSTLIIASLYVFAYNIIFLYYLGSRNGLPVALVALSYSLIITSIFFHKSEYAPLFALAGLFNTALTLTFLGSTSDIQATGSTAIFLCVILSITALPQKIISTWVSMNVALLIFLVFNIGMPTRFFNLEIPVRTFTIIQLIVVAIWFHKSWFSQLEHVRARDNLNLLLLNSRETALELQERTKKWRELLIHTHETVLNDIRSVLDSKEIDFKELNKQLKLRRQLTSVPFTSELNFSDLMSQVQDSVSVEIDLNISGAGTEIPFNISAALRSVIVEVCRNFERHAGASKITTKASSIHGLLRIEIFHNGKDSTSNFDVGIGQGIVIKETLDEVDGKIFRRLNGAEISVPLKRKIENSRSLTANEMGRIAVSVVNVGSSVGGVLFTLSLLVGTIGTERIAGLLTLILTSFAAFVTVKRIYLDAGYVIASSGIASLQAFFTFLSIAETTSVDVLAINIVLTGFSLVAITTWTRDMKWWGLCLPWLLGLIAFRTQIDPEDSGTAIASLNTGFSTLAFAAAAIFSGLIAARRLNDTKTLSELEIKERSAATAVADIAKELDGAIREATKTISSVAKVEHVSPEDKKTLKRLDSLIRAMIQVDPKTSGGFSRAALAIVKHAVSLGVYVKVLTIRDQGVPAEIEDDLLAELARIIGCARDSKTTIQVLADSTSSILVIKLSESTARKSSLENLERFASENLTISLEESDGFRIIFVEAKTN